MKRLAGAIVLLALAWPNDPAPGWYAAPEYLCAAVTREEDQWRCDMDPVGWRDHRVSHDRRH